MSWPSTVLPSQTWPSQEVSRIPLLTIYSARTGRVRRVIWDEALSVAALQAVHGPGVGETLIVLEASADAQADVTQLIGLTPTGDRYAILDVDGVVMGTNIYDPDCGDSVLGYTLAAHAVARPGWRQMLDSSWQRSLPEIDRDIQAQNDILTHRNSQAFIDQQTALGLTTARIDTKRTNDIAAANAEITTLNAEKTAREAPR